MLTALLFLPLRYSLSAPIKILSIFCRYLMCLTGLLMAFAGPGTWTKATGLPDTNAGFISKIVVAPNGVMYFLAVFGLYRSIDGGNSWAPVYGRLPINLRLAALAVDQKNNVYVGGDSAGSALSAVYQSSDAGNSWQPVNLTPKAFSTAVALEVDPASAKLLAANDFAQTFSANLTNGVSTNWINTGTYVSGDYVQSFGFSVTGYLMVSGAFVPVFDTYIGTHANGAFLNGQPIAGILGKNVHGFAATMKGDVYAVTGDKGIFKSSDRGKSWASTGATIPFNTGTKTIDVPLQHVLAIAANSSGTIFAGGSDLGLVSSADGGATWSYDTEPGIIAGEVDAIAIDAKDTVYVGVSVAGKPALFQKSVLSSSSKSSSFRITGTAAGDNSALSLNANIVASSGDTGKAGNLFVIAYIPAGGFYALTSSGWNILNLSEFQPYSKVTLGSNTVNVLGGGFDVSALKGTIFFAGYGVDANDMLRNSKYAQIFTIQ